jgi:hypothetical protein
MANYQSIPDHTQLQLLEGLMRMFLHGVLLAIAGASILILSLCLSEWRLSGRRSSEVAGRGRRRTGDPLLAARRGEPLCRTARER